MSYFLQWLITGIAVGGLYSLIGISVVIIYKSTGVYNFAIGQFLLLGAFIVWTGMDQLHLNLWLSLLLAFVAAFILGLIIERLALRPLTGQPLLSQMLMTLGLSFFLQGVILAVWGGALQRFPEFIPTSPIHMGDVTLSQQYIYMFAIAIVIFALLQLFFYRTRAGLDMRAVADDQQVARVLGVDTRKVTSIAWIVGGILAVIGGVLFGTKNGISQALTSIGYMAFPVAILGGLDSVPGCFAGGLVVGVLQYLAGGYLDPLVGGGTMDLAPFVILIVVLTVKPYGLFGSRRIERV